MGKIAFSGVHIYHTDMVGKLTKAFLDALELAPEELGNTRKNVDIVHLQDGNRQTWLHQQLRAFRHTGHLLSGSGRTLGPVLLQQSIQLGVNHQTPLQPICDRFNRHVIVRGSDTTSGEDVIKGTRERHDITGNHLDVIRDHDNTSDIHAQGAEFLTHIGRVRVHDFPRQDLVANDHDAGCLCHSLSASLCLRSSPQSLPPIVRNPAYCNIGAVMASRQISLVPSKICVILASRKYFSAPDFPVVPYAPIICTASVATLTAMSLANTLAMELKTTSGGSVAAALWVSSRAASICVAMSASICCTIW